MSNSTTLRREMQFRDLLIYGLIFIGPAAPVGIFGTLDARSHGAVALVYVIATIAMGFTALSYARMSMVVPKAGAVYSYASAGIGQRAGFLTGWMVLLDYLLIPAVAYLFTGIALSSLFSGVPYFADVPTWVWTAIAVVFTTGLNLAGVRKAAWAAMVVLIAELIVLALVVGIGVYILAQNGPARPWLSPLAGLHTFSWADVFGAVSIAVLSYLGFDAIATFAEEQTGGKHLIGRATLGCLILAGLLFFVQTYIGALLTPHPPEYFQAHPELQGETYYSTVRSELAPALAVALAFVKALGASFSAMVGQAAGSRLLYSMARDGRAPRMLANVNDKTGTPMKAILVAALFNILIAVWAARTPDGLSHLVSFVDIGALCAFVMLHVSVISYFLIRQKGNSVFTYGVLPAIGALILLPVLFFATEIAQIVGLVWLAIGVAVLLVQGTSGGPGETDKNAISE